MVMAFWIKTGEKLSFVLLTNQGNKIREMVAQIVQQQWAEVGVEVTPRLMEWSAFIHNYVETKKFDAVLLGWSLVLIPILRRFGIVRKVKRD